MTGEMEAEEAMLSFVEIANYGPSIPLSLKNIFLLDMAVMEVRIEVVVLKVKISILMFQQEQLLGILTLMKFYMK